MRIFLIIALLVLGATQVDAQERPGTSPRIPAQTAQPVPGTAPSPAPDRNKTREARFTGVTTACARPGDILTIEGQNLGALGRQVPALYVDGDLLVLTILNKADNRFVVRLPDEGIAADRVYPLYLVSLDTLREFHNTNLRIRICSVVASGLANVKTEREILIFAGQSQKAAVLLELRNRNISTLEETDLNALASVLIRIRSANVASLVDELRAALPGAEIDLNADLVEAKGPRLYVKDKIAWPQIESCHIDMAGISIGLIDGEIDQAHAAFKGQSIFVKNFLEGQTPDRQHATAIASILIGDAPDLGLKGLLPGARLYSAVVLRKSSDDQQVASIRAIVLGLDWLLSQKTRLINISLASDVRNRVLVIAVEQSLKRGAVIFSAVGNQGPEAPLSYPAAIDGVFAVTAIDAADRIYEAANQGDYIDFAAPGVDIWAAEPGGGAAYVTGTSFAAPVALAIAALIQQKNPAISRQVILRALSSNSRDLGSSGRDKIFGNGLLQGNC